MTSSVADQSPTSTARNVVVVTGGKIALLGTWFVATLLMARVLGVVGFGIYTLCTNAIRMVTNSFSDPLDMAVMREAPLHLRSDRPRALELIRSAFWLRMSIGFISIIVTAAVPWLVSRIVFDSPNCRLLAMLTAIGILGDLFLRSVLGYFQASEKFNRFLWTDAVWQFGRAGAVFVLVYCGLLTATSAILLYTLSPFLAAIVGLLLIPRDLFSNIAPAPHQIRQILNYSKWVISAAMMGAMYERLDLFMLGWFRGAAEVGVYGAAMTLAMIPDFLDGSIQTVLAPKIAPAFADGTFAKLQRKYFLYSIPLGSLAATGALLFSGPFIRTFLSMKYQDSVIAFKILIFGTLFNIVVTPLSSALLNFVAPKKVMAVTFVGLAIVAIGGVIVIPKYGVIGAATLILSARITVGLTIVLLAGKLADDAAVVT